MPRVEFYANRQAFNPKSNIITQQVETGYIDSGDINLFTRALHKAASENKVQIDSWRDSDNKDRSERTIIVDVNEEPNVVRLIAEEALSI